jgi:hypothetical protein
MRYAVDGYAVLGYFLQNETQLASSASAVSISTGIATSYIDLQSNAIVVSTSAGDIYSTLDDLQSNAITTSLGSGYVYSTLDLSGNSVGISTLAASISLDAYLVSNAAATVISTGNVYSVLNVASIATANSTMLGDVNPSYHYAAAGYAEAGYFLADEAPVLSSSFAVSTGTGEVYSVLDDLQSNSTVVSTSIGDIYSTIDLSGQSQSISLSTGSINLTQTLLSNAYSVVTTVGRITFPSIYVGDLGIESLTPINTIESLTPVHQIGIY